MQMNWEKLIALDPARVDTRERHAEAHRQADHLT